MLSGCNEQNLIHQAKCPSTPVSDLAVENQKEDVPGYLEERLCTLQLDEG
jgi:hypothetical protein